MRFGDIVAVDGGEITLLNPLDGGELALGINIDGGEIGSTTLIVADLQSGKTVTPTDEEQIVRPDTGYTGLRTVTVERIPSSYGHILYNGSVLTVY